MYIKKPWELTGETQEAHEIRMFGEKEAAFRKEMRRKASEAKKPPREYPWDTLLMALMALASAYVTAAVLHYRLEHPGLTETQLFLHLWDIVRWH